MLYMQKVTNSISAAFFRLAKCAGVSFVFCVLMTACAGDIYEKQADVYETFRARLDTAASCESLKKVNTECESAIRLLLKENGDAVAESYRNSAQYKESINHLKKTESEYVNVYTNKILSALLKKQQELFADYSAKLEKANGYDEFVTLNRTLGSTISAMNKDYAAELKKAASMKGQQNIQAEHNAAMKEFARLYKEKASSAVVQRELALYDEFAAKLTGVNDYLSLKEIDVMLENNVSVVRANNAPVYAGGVPESVVLARNAYKEQYAQKVALPLLEYREAYHKGTSELFHKVKNVDEFKKLRSTFIDVNAIFTRENEEELRWIDFKISAGNKELEKKRNSAEAWLQEINKAIEKKAVELELVK